MAISVFREKLDSGCKRLLTADVGTQVLADSCISLQWWVSLMAQSTHFFFAILEQKSEQDTQIHFWNAWHEPWFEFDQL